MVLDSPHRIQDASWMLKALSLANRSAETSPNPRVGAVFVRDESIVLGEGWHVRAGSPHAERQAWSSLSSPHEARGSTLYVTLEPCNHFGRTPPCTELIIQAGVGRVVVSCTDPNPMIAGKSVALLREAGIPVDIGVKECLGRWINRRFITFHEKRRPFIILKWAQSADGFIAPDGDAPYWLSSPLSRELVHQWRAAEDAILVGTTTAVRDDPALTTRLVTGRNPLRVALDRCGRIPLTHRLFDRSAPTLILGEHRPELPRELFVSIPEGENPLRAALSELYRRSILSVIIEGGAGILNYCLENDLWDEVRVFVAPHKLEGGIAAPPLPNHTPSRELTVGVDTVSIWSRKDSHCPPPDEPEDIAFLAHLSVGA